jgi:hypothetical protein
MIRKNQFFFAIVLLIIVFLIFGILSIFSEGSLYGGDSYTHFLFARFAFAHPQNFLDHWAKQLFTLLASPFSFFGFHGMMLFNILISAFATYFALAVSAKLKYQNLPLIVLFCAFSPIFILLMFSGLTEAVFALLLVAAVCFFVDKKYYVAAILISFIPFIRSEGLIFIVWFFVLFLLKQKFKAIPLLFFGIFFYTILGGFILGDFFWLIHNNPYSALGSVYGSGSIIFYIQNIPSTFGVITFLLAVVGVIVIFVSLFRKNPDIENKELQFNELFLILFSALGYFLFHSIVWWKGWMSVLGDARFMAAIVPLISILALKGFNVIVYPIKNKIILMSVSSLVGILMLVSSLKIHQLPVKLQGGDKVVKEAVLWIAENGYSKSKIVYYNPIVPCILDKDPYAKVLIQERVNDNNQPEKDLPKNTIIIWDGHFSPYEGQLSLDSLKANPSFIVLKEFFPNSPFKIYGDINYQVALFLRK